MMTELIVVTIIVQLTAVVLALVNRHNIAVAKEQQNSSEKKLDKVSQVATSTSLQFVNNGGSTIKDQMDRIERRFIHQDQRMNLLQQADINDRNAAGDAHAAIYEAIRTVSSDMQKTAKESPSDT